MIFDHTGNIARHGMASVSHSWSLIGGGAQPTQRSTTTGEKIREQMECPSCKAVYHPQLKCPECGQAWQTKGRGVTWIDGRLVQKYGDPSKQRPLERQYFYRELRGYCEMKGKKAGYAAHIYKAKFDEWPKPAWFNLAAVLPGRSALNFIKSRQIARSHRILRP